MKCFFASLVIMAALAGMASGQTNMTLSGGPSFSLSDTNYPKLPPSYHVRPPSSPSHHGELRGTLDSRPADLDRYINALQSFVSVKVSPSGFTHNSTPSLAWIQLAMADPTLAKTPNIKRLTLGLLNEGRNMELVENVWRINLARRALLLRAGRPFVIPRTPTRVALPSFPSFLNRNK